jgi:alpha-tubulin suppressor-like RCC1 family protein
VSTNNLTVDPLTPNLPIAFKTVSAGGYHSLAIKTDGTLWAWGVNYSGELGDGTTYDRHSPVQIGTASDWAFVSAGDHTSHGFGFSLAIKENGTLWAWGYNGGGMLGDGTQTQKTTPVQIGNDTWASVSAGDGHTLAIKTDGTLWAWGGNLNGQLGNGTTNNVANPTPVRIGNDTDWASVSAGTRHSLAIKSDGTLWAWGDNFNGQLGNNSTNQQNAPVRIEAANNSEPWISVSAGVAYSLAIKTDGTLWAWGSNANGRTGLNNINGNTLIPEQIPSVVDWASVSAGSAHSLAIKTDGSLWAWGVNNDGQLGDGTQTQKTTPVQIDTANNLAHWASVSAGIEHTLAIKEDGLLWAWGNNGAGQLGDGTTADKHSPIQIGN